MKFYHLADLHIGKSIYGTSMIDDQKDWMSKFLQLCLQEQPDAVVIAGDVYDRSSPSGDAVEVLDRFLTSLAAMNIAVLLIAGNHDSGQRLSFASSLLSRQNIHIAGTLKKEMEHVTLYDEFGPVTFWLMPYTYPEQINQLMDTDLRTYDEAVRSYLSAQNIDQTQRNVIVSHQNVVVQGKEIERGGSESMVGGVGQIDFSAYDSFDYAALGHIHSSYQVGRKEVRYAGTPLCYHMAETRQKEKGPVEVVLKEKGILEFKTVFIEPLHRMRYFSDTKENIIETLRFDSGHDEYIGITITDARIEPELAAYLRQMLELRGSILMELMSSYSAYAGSVNSLDTEAGSQKSVEELFASFYEEMTGGCSLNEHEEEILKMIGELVRNQEFDDEKGIQKIVDAANKQRGDHS